MNLESVITWIDLSWIMDGLQARDAKGRTPLTLAMQISDDVEMIKLFVEATEDLDVFEIVDSDGKMAMNYAKDLNKSTILQLILDRLLYLAAGAGDVEKVQKYMLLGANPLSRHSRP